MAGFPFSWLVGGRAGQPPALTATVEEGTRLRLLGRRLADATPLLERLGQYLVNMNRVGFANQAFGGGSERWAPRKVPNVAGIISDLGRSANVNPSRWTPRPALVDSGRLRASLAYRLVGQRAVEVYVAGAAAAYGARQQAGLPTVLPVTPAVRINLASYLRANPQRRPQLGWIFRQVAVTVTPIPRRFLGIPDGALSKIEALIATHVAQDQAP